MTDSKIIIERIEALGEDSLRQQLATGNVPKDQIASVQIWLGMKEAERKAFREAAVFAAQEQANAARDQANHAAAANYLSAAALLLSILALAVSGLALFKN
jgi:hypothetical protein